MKSGSRWITLLNEPAPQLWNREFKIRKRTKNSRYCKKEKNDKETERKRKDKNWNMYRLTY